MNISRTLDALLFGRDTGTIEISMTYDEWIKKYKPIKNHLDDNAQILHKRFDSSNRLANYFENKISKWARKDGANGWNTRWPRVSWIFYKEVMGTFETYGEDLEYVKSQNELNIWTEIHASGSFEGIESGFLAVDRLLYYVTKIPRNPNEVITIDYHDECNGDYPECCETKICDNCSYELEEYSHEDCETEE